MLDLAKLVDEDSDYLFRYALRHFKEEDVAQELVQETFLAAVQSVSRFEGTSSSRTWLTSILKHKIIDRIRKKSRAQTISLDQSPGMEIDKFFDEHDHWTLEAGPLPWSANPENVFTQREFLQVLDKCMNKLPEQQRDIFILREVEGYEQEELCKEFSLSATNLRVILHRLRVLIRNCLQVNWLENATKGT